MIYDEQYFEECNVCEENTDYHSALEGATAVSCDNFSFDTVRFLSRHHGVWEELNSGVAILQNTTQLEQYVYSYGPMHNAKLRQAFTTFIKHDFFSKNQVFEIIDYGCGQALGSIVLCDILRFFIDFNFTISRIKLIEPSLLALQRAALHSRYSLKKNLQPENVQAINKTLAALVDRDLKTDSDSIKFHVFSNILDIPAFDIVDLAEKIKRTQLGINYFICVSPNFFSDGSHPRNSRLTNFMNCFRQEIYFESISERVSNIGDWTRFERIFKTTIS